MLKTIKFKEFFYNIKVNRFVSSNEILFNYRM